MNIVKLNYDHRDMIKDLFLNKSYMGEKDITLFYRSPASNDGYDNFVSTYLSGLKNYISYGYIENNTVRGLISAHQNFDEPSWYYTQVRSNGDAKNIKFLLDTMCDYQESCGRFKFYSLWNKRYIKSIRRFAFTDRIKERYDYFDEYYVPVKLRCFYTNHWQILFNRVLLPVDTVVRCTFLKQKYRNQLPIGGGL